MQINKVFLLCLDYLKKKKKLSQIPFFKKEMMKKVNKLLTSKKRTTKLKDKKS